MIKTEITKVTHVKLTLTVQEVHNIRTYLGKLSYYDIEDTLITGGILGDEERDNIQSTVDDLYKILGE